MTEKEYKRITAMWQQLEQLQHDKGKAMRAIESSPLIPRVCKQMVCDIVNGAYNAEMDKKNRAIEEIKVSWEGDEEMDIYEEIKKIKEENAALRAKVEELTGRNAADEKRIAEVIEDIMSRKDEPACKEIRENCVMINFLANQMQGEKPYYSILYYDKRDDCYYDGFGSYDHEIVNAYKEAYFDHWDKGYFEKQIEELKDKEV